MLNTKLAKPCIKAITVDIKGPAFVNYHKERDSWTLHSNYSFPYPTQFFGPDEISDQRTITLKLEKGKKQ